MGDKDKKYKIDMRDMSKQEEAKAKEAFSLYLQERMEFDPDDYEADGQRMDIFHAAKRVCEIVFSEEGQTVRSEVDSDDVGGEITVALTEANISGEKLEAFIAALQSANIVEFSAFLNGTTEIGLVYTDLKDRRDVVYDN